MASFNTEKDGQLDFFRTFLPRVNPSLGIDEIIADGNDGVINGNLLEFKTRLDDLNAALSQSIKYLSARRLKGKPVPANIVIISLEESTAYIYSSTLYLHAIEKVYSGPLSKNNAGFTAGKFRERLDYSKQPDAERLVGILKSDEYTRIHIDENCIVGWAEEYYRLRPGARKEHFIGDSSGKHRVTGEIRQPKLFERYILPYKGRTNVRFDYLMDCLNDFLQKKDLGAFFTPEPYAAKARELLRAAIARVPEGNSYVIIDRCAGTGNLERGLSDEELAHCIVSTKEYYEYKVLQELIGSKVMHIIPPIEVDDTFDAGNVRGADALTEEYVKNPIICRYLEDPACTVILFENPPYAETTSMEHQKLGAAKKSSAGWKSSWVVGEMRKAVKGSRSVKGAAVNDMANAFIWSGFEYYLRQPTDSYVLFSPIKYWKAQGLVNKKLLGGFCGDRHHFHALKHTCVAVTLWSNEEDSLNKFELEGFDIADGGLVAVGKLPMRRVSSTYSELYFDKREIPAESRVGILCGLNGLEKLGANTQYNKPAYGRDILGYLAVYSSGFDNPDAHSSLLVGGRYDGHGFYLRRDNFLEKLPMFAASRYISYNGSWTERGRVMKSADGAERFFSDLNLGKLEQWLLKTLIFTCMEYQNHMRSFKGSDGRLYRNELCLDATNGPTAASEALSKLEKGEKEEALLFAWDRVLEEAKTTKNYNASLAYGLYQIGEELNTSHPAEDNEKKKVYDYPALNGAIKTLKKLNKEYYLQEIVPTLFKYEFLK